MGLFNTILHRRLTEKAVGAAPTYLVADVGDLLRDCSDSLWMLEQRKFVYRGDSHGSPHDVSVVRADATERASENTKNSYTLLFDEWFRAKYQDFPLRSRSLICSTDAKYAAGCGTPYYVIPTNSSRIGVVNSHDIWWARNNSVDGLRPPELNQVITLVRSWYRKLPQQITVQDLRSAFTAIAKNSEKWKDFKESIYMFRECDTVDDAIELMVTATDPKMYGFTSATPATLSGIYSANLGELWIDGAVYMVRADDKQVIEQVIEAIKPNPTNKPNFI